MDLKFSKIVSKESRKAEMLLYGELGDAEGEINGHYFAQELAYLGKNNDEITIRVNSGGGLVSHGYSVFSQAVTSPAKIIVQVDGIAASMAAVLLAAADEVHVMDYARVMLHSPYYKDTTKKLSDADKKVVSLLRDSLVTMLTKRGIEREAADAMITTTDKWLTAEEAITAKIADKIITTGKKKTLAALDFNKLAAQVTSESIINPNNLKMKQLIAKFALPETAAEADILTAVNKLEQDNATALQAAQDRSAKLIDKLIAVGKVSGTITDANEPNFKKLAETDIELFASMINVKKEDLEGSAPRLSAIIAQLEAKAGKPDSKEADKDFEWYEKNDPQALAEMRSKQPDAYKALKAADDKKYQ